MRKDVKFGLTIGGLLIAVLVVWIIATNHGDKNKQPDVSLANPNADTGIQPANEGAPAPAPAPEAPKAPDPVRTTTPTPGATGTPAVTTTTPPATGTPSSTVGSNGAVANLTPTPISTGAAGSSTAPKASNWDQLMSHGPSAGLFADTGRSSTPTASSGGNAVVVDPLPDNSTSTTRPTLANGSRTHKVQNGETFASIARTVYGNGKYYKKLIDANPNVNPNRLKVGTDIVIPELTTSESSATASASTSDSTPAPNTQTGAPKTPADPKTTYIVQSSDTLEKIARKLYGDGAQWDKIYEANKDVIGPNPSKLKLNMVLRLPEPPTVASTN
jgi:nucleoid-associated protein YgaU